MDRLSILRRFQIGLTGTFSKGLSYEKLMRTGIASYEGMKSLNLKVALILLTIGAVLLMISVTPYQGGMICTLTEDAALKSMHRRGKQQRLSSSSSSSLGWL